ncbi:hypothetical protein [Allorhizocola rhizosphaerae]|uniref:DUF7919 family protein n=1 Tax=Allorhizocola rhizosphaerae TaxID=1872709 RepID=UPI0013C2B5EB|nr:hypothetical protein [Allorhizocola rhizosphaerae]
MTYFADLSPYTYLKSEQAVGLLCVGWLEAGHEYPIGPTPPRFVARLGKLCAERKTAQTRGFHRCTFKPCDKLPHWPPLSTMINDREVFLGSAEIRVSAGKGISFAAPDLIYHYVVDHGYKPPAQFVEAVMHCDERGSDI